MIRRAIARVLGAAAPRGLHICEECGRDRVAALGWEAWDGGWTTIDLRCGECGARREETVRNAEAAAFGAVLDAHRREIEAALQELDFTH